MDNNPDKEVVERLTQALSQCRTCTHVMMTHSFTKHHGGRCIDAIVKVTGEHKICNCKLFIPKDNLEFLEWMAKNKSKEK